MLIQRCLSSENPRRVSRGLSTSCRTRFVLAGIFRFAGELHYASDEGACEISQLVGKCCLGPYICSFRVRFVSHTGVHGRICIPNFIPVSAGSYPSPPPTSFFSATSPGAHVPAWQHLYLCPRLQHCMLQMNKRCSASAMTLRMARARPRAGFKGSRSSSHLQASTLVRGRSRIHTWSTGTSWTKRTRSTGPNRGNGPSPRR